MLNDFLVGGREWALAYLLRFDDAFVLNSEGEAGPRLSGTAMTEALTASMQALHDVAVQDQGAHVDYATLAESEPFQRYRNRVRPALRTFDPLSLKTDGQRLAFWINLYNLLVIDAVLAFDIKESVTEGWVGILRFFRHSAYDVGGFRFSCEAIEQGVLRFNRGNPYLPGPQFGAEDRRRDFLLQPFEPLIHFGLNCASRSCPPLRVFNADQVQGQLARAASDFLAGDVEIDAVGRQVVLSLIFRWFGMDFGGKSGVLAFLNAHLPPGGLREQLGKLGPDVKIRYRSYDWQLNRIPVTSSSLPSSPRPSASPIPRR